MGKGYHRRSYPYPFPIQYPTWGPWWGSERILLVEPDKKPDPCPTKWELKDGKCVKKVKEGLLKRLGLHGLDGALDNPMNVAVIAGAGLLGYFLGKRSK